MGQKRLRSLFIAGVLCLAATPGTTQYMDSGASGESGLLSGNHYVPDWDAVCAAGAALGEGCEAIRARSVADPAALPWRAIGRVNFASTQIRSHCTGTLVAEDIVVTAAHCLYNTFRNAWVPPASIRFAAGYRQGEVAAVAQVARYVLGPELAAEGAGGEPTEDWVLLILKTPIGRETGYLDLAGAEGADGGGADMLFAGYAGLRPHVLSLTEECGARRTAFDGRLLVLDCAVMEGDSGGPVLQKVGDGLVLAGVLTGVFQAGDALVSGSVPVASFADALRAETSAVPAGAAPVAESDAAATVQQAEDLKRFPPPSGGR